VFVVKGRSILKGISSVECLVLISLTIVAAGLYGSKAHVVSQANTDDAVFAVAASFASGVLFAHQQWQLNGHVDGNNVDNLQAFRQNNLNMTFNGWPRGKTGDDNHSNMTHQSCTELWQGLVDDRWQDKFTVTAITANTASLGACRYTAVQADGFIEYDVKRGRVILTMG